MSRSDLMVVVTSSERGLAERDLLISTGWCEGKSTNVNSLRRE